MNVRSPRDRISALFGADSFHVLLTETDSVYVNAECHVNGRKIFVSATDPASGLKRDIFKSIQLQGDLLEKAYARKKPLVLLTDEPGPRLMDKGEPADTMARLFADPRGMGRIFQLHGRLSGHVPQIAVVFGRLTAALAFPPAFCDYVVMLQNSAACLGAPSVVKQLIGEDGSLTDLGGPEMHTRISGYADQIAADEGEAFDLVRQMLSLVLRPKENAFAAPKTADWEVIDRFLSDRHRSFDMHCLIDCFVDQGSLLEFKPFFAAEVMTGLARVEGRTIGIIANNSLHRAGLIFPETCRKMMRFIKFCDSFSIPLLFIVDTPGFMVGRDVEKAGSIVQGSELFQTIASLRIPHMTLVARHAHTAGIYAMAGPGFSPALFCALPSASISIFEKKASERLSSSPALAGPVANALQELAAIEDSPLFFKTTGLLDEVIELKALRDVIRNFLPERQS